MATATTAAAGEHYVAYRLSAMGLLAALTRGGSPAVDIIVGDPSGKAAVSLQVKTSMGAWRPKKRQPEKSHWEWTVSKNASLLRGDSFFNAFVDLKWHQGTPDVFIIPSTFVADRFTGTSYKMNVYWLWEADGATYRNNWEPVKTRLGVGIPANINTCGQPPVGFRVAYQLDPKQSESEWDEFGQSFISQAIEGNGLCYHGGGRDTTQGFASAEDSDSATEDQRSAVDKWLRSNRFVVQCDVGPLEPEADA